MSSNCVTISNFSLYSDGTKIETTSDSQTFLNTVDSVAWIVCSIKIHINSSLFNPSLNPLLFNVKRTFKQNSKKHRCSSLTNGLEILPGKVQ